MQIPLLICVLHLLNVTSQTKSLPVRRSSSVASLCPLGCATCSATNGCLTCRPRLFFHLELVGMQQKGSCLAACPQGYHGKRSPLISTCSRCRDGCESCFSEDFCTRCRHGHFLFRGKCTNSCPKGLLANASLRECTVHCELGEWTSWGRCMQNKSVRPQEGQGATSPRSTAVAAYALTTV